LPCRNISGGNRLMCRPQEALREKYSQRYRSNQERMFLLQSSRYKRVTTNTYSNCERDFTTEAKPSEFVREQRKISKETVRPHNFISPPLETTRRASLFPNHKTNKNGTGTSEGREIIFFFHSNYPPPAPSNAGSRRYHNIPSLPAPRLPYTDFVLHQSLSTHLKFAPSCSAHDP